MKNRLICASSFVYNSYRNKIFYFESYAEFFNIPFIIHLIDSNPNMQFYKEKSGDGVSLYCIKEGGGTKSLVGHLKYDMAEIKDISQLTNIITFMTLNL